jgi:hypothetical protein
MEKRTTKPEYVEPLLETLRTLKIASEKDLLAQTYELIKERLHPTDFVQLPNGEPRWLYQMQHMLDGLIESGKILKEDGVLIINDS